ncbi:hypothetical protein M9H77_08122 [Catharanthus roseus]|uniref:Uncharacterized protein n=1 Tax=Catharanthus roseus TaxID=4058 RepID=A0ACC0BX46_CATRO|nr:hypothetical protein M9H77_08122 [Catharanthus roseus]
MRELGSFTKKYLSTSLTRTQVSKKLSLILTQTYVNHNQKHMIIGSLISVLAHSTTLIILTALWTAPLKRPYQVCPGIFWLLPLSSHSSILLIITSAILFGDRDAILFGDRDVPVWLLEPKDGASKGNPDISLAGGVLQFSTVFVGENFGDILHHRSLTLWSFMGKPDS